MNSNTAVPPTSKPLTTSTAGRRDEPAVVVLDDDSGLCDSLRYLIESVGLSVQTYLTHTEFFARFDFNRPGCIVLDVRMPGMSGLEVQEMLRARGSTHPIIMITGHGDVAMAIRAMKAGAFDFIEKPFSDQVLLDRIQHAVATDVRQRLQKRNIDAIRERFCKITPREMQVIERVVAGHSNKTIAEALGVSRKTVEVHRAHIMDKTGAQSLAELVQLTLSAGLLGNRLVPADKPRTGTTKVKPISDDGKLRPSGLPVKSQGSNWGSDLTGSSPAAGPGSPTMD